MMKKILLLIIAFSLGCSIAKVNLLQKNKEEYVVLLHGLARTNKSMKKLQKALLEKDYGVCNYDYPSRKYKIEKLAYLVIPNTLKFCRKNGAKKIHFVTHSLGGIILRYYLIENTIPDLGRVVMLSPPNQGSEVVDVLRHNIVFTAIHGPAGNQLGTEKGDIPKQLGRVDFELGIITGKKSINPILSMIIDGEDDGKVSIQNAKVEGMKEFIIYDTSHPFIMKNDGVIKLVIRFLKFGSFKEKIIEPTD